MANQQMETLLFQVEQLYQDLDKVIAQERWGGAQQYVGFYNKFLSQAKALLPDLPLDALPEVEQARGSFPERLMAQKVVDREAQLALLPLCGQLLAWVRRGARG